MTNYSSLRNAFNKSIYASDLSTSARFVAITLSEHMNNTTGRCFPSIALLSSKTGMSESSVKRSIKELKDNEYIEVIKMKGKAYSYNEYRLGVNLTCSPCEEDRLEVRETCSPTVDEGLEVKEAGGLRSERPTNTVTNLLLPNTLIDSKREDEVVDVEDDPRWEEFFGKTDDESGAKETWTVPDLRADELIESMMGRKEEAGKPEEEEVNPYTFVHDPGMSDEDNALMEQIVDENRMRWDEERLRV